MRSRAVVFPGSSSSTDDTAPGRVAAGLERIGRRAEHVAQAGRPVVPEAGLASEFYGAQA